MCLCKLLGKDHLPMRLPVGVLEHIITKTAAVGEENSYLFPTTPLEVHLLVQDF